MYRGQQSTQQKIQAITSLRITTRSEAIAFLRAISNIEVQIADILQRENMKAVAANNQTVRPIEEAKEVQEVPVAVEEEAPVTFEEEEGHTEEQKESLLDKLKRANKK